MWNGAFGSSREAADVRYEKIRVLAVMTCAEGLSKSLGAKGILDGSYSLVGGVAKALAVPGLEERWLNGDNVFTDLRTDKGRMMRHQEDDQLR